MVDQRDRLALTQLTFDPGLDTDPDPSADRTKIVFESTRLGGGSEPAPDEGNEPEGSPFDDIFVMNANGTGQTQLTNLPNVDQDEPAFSPDDTRIVWEDDRNTAGNSDIFVMNANGTGQTALTQNSSYDDDDPKWQPIPIVTTEPPPPPAPVTPQGPKCFGQIATIVGSSQDETINGTPGPMSSTRSVEMTSSTAAAETIGSVSAVVRMLVAVEAVPTRFTARVETTTSAVKAATTRSARAVATTTCVATLARRHPNGCGK